jgi:hypothetical protein
MERGRVTARGKGLKIGRIFRYSYRLQWRATVEEHPMRNRRLSCIVALAVMALGIARSDGFQGPGDAYVGTWSGTWEGPGTGTFELTLSKDKDGAVGGKVVVTGEGSDYNADLKAVV